MAIIISVLLGWLWAGPMGLFMGLQLVKMVHGQISSIQKKVANLNLNQWKVEQQ